MDVMVQWDETPGEPTSIARVSSVESAETLEHPTRDVVTLYGTPTPESLALALAAAVEARRSGDGAGVARELRVTASQGAVGDTAVRDKRTGEVIRRELTIPLTVLKETAGDLLKEGGQAIRRLLAGLLQPEWPEGTRRALSFQLAQSRPARNSDMLSAMREADGDNFREDE